MNIRAISSCFFFTLSFVTYGQRSLLVDKSWIYEKVAIIYQQDTLVLFHADSTRNIWYMGRISLSLTKDGNYNGIDINGNIKLGTWDMPNPQSLAIDQDINQLNSLSETRFSGSTLISYNLNNTLFTGRLLTVFRSVPVPRDVCESIKSGDWVDPTTWSCGHEPVSTTLLVINQGHTITVSTNDAQAQRIIFNGGIIKFQNPINKIKVSY